MYLIKLVCFCVVVILGLSTPFHFELEPSLNFIVPSVAFAKGGDGSDGDGDGEGGSSGSGSDGSGGSGSSGNSGSGSANSGSGKSGGGSSNNSSDESRSQKGHKYKINRVERNSVSDIEVHYSNGWTEQIKSGLYELRDNINRKVIGRKARQDDYDRFQDISPDR